MSKVINVNEFRQEGFLQEVNRTFLHQLGLNLRPCLSDDGTSFIIEDHRDDPEGCMFAPGVIDPKKRDNVKHIKESKREARFEAVGGFTQVS